MFRDFLEKHNADIVEIEAGAFKESGTGIGTMHIRIRKMESSPAANLVTTVMDILTPAGQLGYTWKTSQLGTTNPSPAKTTAWAALMRALKLIIR